MREELAAGTLAPVVLAPSAEAESAVRAAFDWMDPDGATSTECWTDYSKKLEHLRGVDAAAKIREAMAAWANHDAALGALLETPENIVAALHDAGAPTRFGELEHPSDPADIVWALQNCHLMRNRFTVADLAYLTGNWTPQDVVSALDEAAELGAGL